MSAPPEIVSWRDWRKAVVDQVRHDPSELRALVGDLVRAEVRVLERLRDRARDGGTWPDPRFYDRAIGDLRITAVRLEAILRDARPAR